MKSLFGLSRKFLRRQWKRTIFTCLGIVLATGLFSSIAIMATSIQNMAVVSVETEEGKWHYALGNLSTDGASALASHNRVAEAELIPHSELYPHIHLETEMESNQETEDSDDEYPVIEDYWIMLKDISASADKDVSITLKSESIQGRLPENENEIVLSATVQYLLSGMGQDASIGSDITLPVGNYGETDTTGTRTWSVVGQVGGFMHESLYEGKIQYLYEAYTIVPENERAGAEVYVTMNKLDMSMDSFLKAVQDAEPSFTYELHEGTASEIVSDHPFARHGNLLLRQGISWDNEINKLLFISISIVSLIILFSVIIVIRNSLSMSVNERVSEFGLLRMIGGSPAQMRRLVIADAVQIAVLSIPAGVGLGILAMKITLMVVANVELDDLKYLQLIVSPLPIIFAIVISLLAVFLSALSPARRAGKMSALDAVRKSDAIRVNMKKEKNIKRRGKLTGRIFGASGALAMKNIRRDYRRFRTTSISVAISAFLFVTIGGFIFALDAASNNFAPPEVDYRLNYWRGSSVDNETGEEVYGIAGQNDSAMRDLYLKVSGIDIVDKTAHYRELNTYFTFSNLDFSDEYKRILSDSGERRFDTYSDEIVSVEARWSFIYGIQKEALPDLGISDVDTVWAALENGEVILYQNQSHRFDTGGSLAASYPMTRYKKGDIFPLQSGSDFSENVLDEYSYYSESIKSLHLTGVRIAEEVTETPWFATRNSCTLFFSKNYLETHLSTLSKEDFEATFSGLVIAIDGKTGNEDAVRDQLKSIIDAKDGEYSMDGEYMGESISLEDVFRFYQESRNRDFVVKIFLYGFLTVILLICVTNILNIIHTNILLRHKEFGLLQAVGMARRQIQNMLYLECGLYGLTGAFWGTILGAAVYAGVMFISSSMTIGIVTSFIPWNVMGMTLLGAFLLASLAGVSPIRKVMKSQVMEMIRTED